MPATLAASKPALSRAESRRVIAKRPEHMGAWDYCQRGVWHVNKGTRTDGMACAEQSAIIAAKHQVVARLFTGLSMP